MSCDVLDYLRVGAERSCAKDMCREYECGPNSSKSWISVVS